ncbi:MAG: type II toxin-antitoxin system PemK/MazF family toxin [Chloroflexota bacterium]|nr:type II toxin-antitoxin system PemK/MazF family toxin [Chloroflexota bacterium]
MFECQVLYLAHYVLLAIDFLKAARLPVCVQVSPADSGLPRESVVNLGHVYTVDKSQLRQLIGRLPAGSVEQIDKALRVSVGLEPFEL